MSLAPHVTTAAAAVATGGDQQRGGSPPERFVRQPADHRVPCNALAPAAVAPVVRLDDPARQHRTASLDVLANDLQAEFVQAGERGQVGTHEVSVQHVGVFRMGGVRTSITGRPRPSQEPYY